MAIKLVEQKNKKGEPNGMFDLYIKSTKDSPVYAAYASVHEPKLKYQSETEKEYAVTLFVSEDDAKVLDDEVRLNKELSKVDVDKNKKKKIRFFSDDYPFAKGMVGFNITCPEFSKKGKKQTIALAGENGKKLPEDVLIGNGSEVIIKCFGYRNEDDLLVIILKAMRVVKLVPYESNNTGKFVDDEMGIHFDDEDKVDFDSEMEGDDEPPFDSGDSDDDSEY